MSLDDASIRRNFRDYEVWEEVSEAGHISFDSAIGSLRRKEILYAINDATDLKDIKTILSAKLENLS